MQYAHLLIVQHLAQIAQMHDPQSFRFNQEQQGFSPLCPLLVVMVSADSRDPDSLCRRIQPGLIDYHRLPLKVFHRVVIMMVM